MSEGMAVRERVRDFALGLPGAHEDFPWGDRVVKVNKKIFVFLGSDDDPAGAGMAVKLVESHAQAMDLPGAKPSGYGLGKAGWVVVPLDGDQPQVEVLTDWVEESYRLVAPKRLVAQLEEREG